MQTDNLKKYAREGLNVILTGKHSVGKTAIIKEVFEEVFGEYYTNWRYFSASTLDPWVDFIGIPKSVTTAEGKEVFKILPPENFTGEENVQAIFFDELNRADEKTLNALMELIQFKTINGRAYPNLKCIWAAENPADDDTERYSVKELDPAQKDRFHVQISVPYTLSKPYFESKYGKDITKIAATWWESRKKAVSPRKLDHILSAFMKGFNIQDFTNQCNLKELTDSLVDVGTLAIAREVVAKRDPDHIRQFFTVDMIRSKQNIFSNNKNIIGGILEFLDEETQEFAKRTLKLSTRVLDKKSIPAEIVEFAKKSAGCNYFADIDVVRYVRSLLELNKTIKLEDMDLDEVYVSKIFPFAVDSRLSTARIRKMIQELETAGAAGEFVDAMNLLYRMIHQIKNSKAKSKAVSKFFAVMSKLSGNGDFRGKFKPDMDYIKTVMISGGSVQEAITVVINK